MYGSSPPTIENPLEVLLRNGRLYQSFVDFSEENGRMEATSCTFRDVKNKQNGLCWVLYSTNRGFRTYAMVDDAISCWHGTVVLCEKYGSVSLHQFIDERNLFWRWREQYDNISFMLPYRGDVEKVFLDAHDTIAWGECMNATVALAPPRGRPLKCQEASLMLVWAWSIDFATHIHIFIVPFAWIHS